MIQAAGVPYTIVRATQFMEFIGGIADFSTDGGTVEIVGPDRTPFAAIVTRYLKSAGDARIGRVSLDQWLVQAKKG